MTAKRTAFVALVGALLFGLVFFFRGPGRSQAVAEPPTASKPQPNVRTVTARSGEIAETGLLTGVLRSDEEARYAAGVGGRVLEARPRIGDRVRRGDVLVRLDPREYEQALREAEAARDAAREDRRKATVTLQLKQANYELDVARANAGLKRAQSASERAQTAAALAKDGSEAKIAGAVAALRAAQASLAVTARSPRPQERTAARVAFEKAEAAAAAAQRHAADAEFLYRKGGLTRVERDQAREAAANAKRDLRQARDALALLDAGPAPEVIAAAQAQVEQSRTALQAARAQAGRAELALKDLEAAQLGLEDAQISLKAAQGSKAALAVPEADKRAAAAQSARAEIAVQMARDRLRQTTLRSGLDGLVREVSVHPGEVVQPGAPLVSVVSTRGIYLEANAPARLARQIQVGQPAQITTDVIPNRTFSGKVSAVSRLASADGRSYVVRVALRSQGLGLEPGAAARARVVLSRHSRATLVPVDTLHYEGGKASLWIVVGSQALRWPVTVGLQNETDAEILGGIQPGDQVIVGGGQSLEPGQAVTIQGKP